MSTLSNTIVEYKHAHGVNRYRIVQETAYHADTPDRVILVLQQAWQCRTRIKITYGDLATGKVWGDRPVSGRLGRSTGEIKVPLLLKNQSSVGGEALLDHCIVKIEYANKKQGKAILWDVTGKGYSSK